MSFAMNVTVEGRYFAIREFLRLLRTRADVKANKVHASGRLFAIDTIGFAGGKQRVGQSDPGNPQCLAFAFAGPLLCPARHPDGTSTGVAATEPGSEASGG